MGLVHSSCSLGFCPEINTYKVKKNNKQTFSFASFELQNNGNDMAFSLASTINVNICYHTSFTILSLASHSFLATPASLANGRREAGRQSTK